MITGAARGSGRGEALARHLTKAENDEVVLVAARGLGSETLAAQIRELVALSLGGRTDRPIYHVHADPDPDLGIIRNADARALFWRLFETEFGLVDQPFCGVEHVKHGRRHEHRVYSVVRPSGAVTDLAWDYVRREKCARIVEHAFGVPPVPSKHARSIVRRLRKEGRHDVADWLVRSGTTTAPRPIAPLTPTERLIQERSGVQLDDLRRAALSAWHASRDAASFCDALAERGLVLRQGRKGPVVVDGSGATHLVTRLVGVGSRRFDGQRILAGEVLARLAGLPLKDLNHGRSGHRATARSSGPGAARDPGGPGALRYERGIVGIPRPDRDAGRPDGSGGRRDRGRPGAALGRLRALPVGRRMILRRRLNAIDPRIDAFIAAGERARAAIERIEAENAYERERAWALWGLTDIWGLPLT